MKQKSLWSWWLYLYILCAVLGFIPEPRGLIKALMVLCSVAFFVPGFLLLRRGDKNTVRLVRVLSLSWLIAATVLVMLNFASALMTRIWGQFFYYAMVMVVSPMVCGQYWVLSLFLAACLMICARTLEKKKD